MKIKQRRQLWRSRALYLIDQFERGVISDLSAKSLAEMTSVSRSTLWRDAEITRRLAEAKAQGERARKDRPRRSCSMDRVRALEAQLASVQADNDRLIDALAKLYLKLHQSSLDPTTVSASSCQDASLADRLAASIREMMVGRDD